MEGESNSCRSTREEGDRDSRRQEEFLVCPLGSAPGRSVSEQNEISSGLGIGTETSCLSLDANDCHWALESNSSGHRQPLQAVSPDLLRGKSTLESRSVMAGAKPTLGSAQLSSVLFQCFLIQSTQLCQPRGCGEMWSLCLVDVHFL